MPHLVHRLLLGAALSVTGLVLSGPGAVLAAAGGNDTSDAARGRVYAGLTKADARHCGGRGFSVDGHPGVCTHGPDSSPVGTDVRTWRSTSELKAAGAYSRAAAGGQATTAGATVGTQSAPTDGTGAIVCEGDGTTGPRTQVLYVRASDVPSRFAALADTFGAYMVAMDGKYNASAQETGGSRHVRFVTEPSATGPCQLSLREVVVSPTGDDSFSNTISQVKAAGWDASTIGQPRKFLLLVDANVLCGIGQVYGDDQPGQANANNSVMGMYDRSDQGCWNYAEAHELMHNIGGVQLSAPHSSGAYHCNDEYDLECYNDGGSTSSLQYPCPSSHEQRFDCNHDDYFHTNPPAGSYLATHWNTASSKFLIASGTSTEPAPTVRSESLSGKLGSGGTAVLTRSVAPGETSARATSFVRVKGKNQSKPISVRVTNAAGQLVASASGTGSTTVTYTAPSSGPLTWTLVGSSGASWTLALSYLA